MKKFLILGPAFAMLVLASQFAFAGSKICLKDNYGDSYTLTGGSLDHKSYSVKVDAAGLCVAGGHAEVTLNSDGKYVLGMYTSHDIAGNCVPVRWIAAGDALLNSIGSYDQLEDGTIDGAITFGRVDCSTLPVYGPVQMLGTTPDPDSPFIAKQ